MATKTIIITTIPAKAGPFVMKKAPTIVSTANPGILTGKLTTTTPATILCKRPLPSPSWENVAPTAAPPRKRERLTHLSQEEKLNRRKLKNRIAAQTARDRKKVKMNGLEDSIDELQTENETLHIENSELRHKTKELLEENALLKKQLEETRREKELFQSKNVTGTDSVALGSAAGADDESNQQIFDLDPPEYALEAIIRDLLEGTEQFQVDPQGDRSQHQNQLGNIEGVCKSEPIRNDNDTVEDSKKNSTLASAESDSSFESLLIPNQPEDSDIFLSQNVTTPLSTSTSALKPSSPFGIVPTSPRNDRSSLDGTFAINYSLNLEDLEKNLNQKPLADLDFDSFEDFLIDEEKTTSPMWADSFTDLFQSTS